MLSWLLRPIYFFLFPQDSLKLAVLWEDIGGIDYVLLNKLKDKDIKKKIIDQSSRDLLIISYNYANTDMAEKLITIGVNFKSEYILYINKYLPIVNMKQHLNSIKNFIDQDEF